MADATELSKIFRIRKTVAKMLTKRCVWALPPLPAARVSAARARRSKAPPLAAPTTTLAAARRKYNVDDEELEMTMEQFQEKFGLSPSRDSLTMLVRAARADHARARAAHGARDHHLALHPTRRARAVQVGKVNDPADRVLVYFPEGDIGVKECKPCVARLRPRPPRHSIVAPPILHPHPHARSLHPVPRRPAPPSFFFPPGSCL